MEQLAISFLVGSKAQPKLPAAISLVLWRAPNTGQCLWWLFSGPFPASTCAAPGMSSGFGSKPYHYPTKPSILQRQGDIKLFISPAIATGRDQGSNYEVPWEMGSALQAFLIGMFRLIKKTLIHYSFIHFKYLLPPIMLQIWF